MSPVLRGIDRIAVTFDEPNLVANAGLLLVATVAVRLGLERLIDSTLDLSVVWAVHGPGARCSPWSTPWPLAEATSIMQMCSVPGQRVRCSGTG